MVGGGGRDKSVVAEKESDASLGVVGGESGKQSGGCVGLLRRRTESGTLIEEEGEE